MKKLALLLSLAVLSSCASQTSFNTFYKNNNEYSDFSLGLNSSLIAGFLSDDDEDVKELLKKAKHVRVMVFSDDYDQMNSKFNKFVNRSTFDRLVKVKENDESVNLYALEADKKIKEIVIQISTGDELVLLGLKTNLTHEDLATIFEENDITFN